MRFWVPSVMVLALAATGCFPQQAPHRPNTADSLAKAMEKPALVEFLDLTGKPAEAWPDDLSNFTSLSRLSLRKNGLSVLPESVKTIPGLVWLDLGENKLSAFPEPGLIPRVVTLYLSDNALTELPASINGMSALAYLNLDRNRLTALPETIGQMESLKWLRLNNNQLTSLPDSIGNLKNLKRLYLRGNPLPEAEKDRVKKLLPQTDVLL